HHYLDQRILVSEWYPESDQLALLRVIVRFMPKNEVDPWELMGRFTAERDLGTLYKSLVRPHDPVGTLRNGALFWGRYHNTGRVTVTLEGEGAGRITLEDYGMPSREMCGILGGWYRELVRTVGGRNVEITHGRCVSRGADACEWGVKWTEAPPTPP
ncbi:MAG: hypothetical protein ACE5FC_06005, partial [Myxococcota bacterium]